MFKVKCPHCYHTIDRRLLWFVCTGHPVAGSEKCEKRFNRLRQNQTGYRVEMYPAFGPTRPLWRSPSRWWRTPRTARCPYCGGQTGQHLCPRCNTPLPSGFGRGSSPLIAIAGARSTGKTVYLTVLTYRLQHAMNTRFRADVLPVGDDVTDWLKTNQRLLFENGDLPEFTQQPDGRSEPLIFQWRRRSSRLRRRFRTDVISLLDTPGESLSTRTRADELQYLGNVDAFIVLLDPLSLPGLQQKIKVADGTPIAEENALQVLSQVTGALRRREGRPEETLIDKPIAIAFAKIDLLREHLGADHALFRQETEDPWYDETAGEALSTSMRGLLHEWGAAELDIHLESNYQTYRYFALSSLGRQPNYAANKIAQEGVSPQRVTDPLEWLLTYYRLIPRRKTRG
ncbi:hypothetical protein [Actinoplanes regularis]|uniref:hypothetical protein n=1 Tax=Actinoplanes regularis TaxID=52697 RepID=UPI0024A1D471|nr:hypothetical protein [Actinoplanes regularis]GLW29813.1 putative ESX-1 scaffolding and assembly protein SaeC [Actinoplanes regularis]